MLATVGLRLVSPWLTIETQIEWQTWQGPWSWTNPAEAQLRSSQPLPRTDLWSLPAKRTVIHKAGKGQNIFDLHAPFSSVDHTTKKGKESQYLGTQTPPRLLPMVVNLKGDTAKTKPSNAQYSMRLERYMKMELPIYLHITHFQAPAEFFEGCCA